MNAYSLPGSDDDRWKDYLKKFLIITIGGALASRVVRRVGKKVMEEAKAVDLNKLIEDPKAESKRLAEKWKKEGQEGIDSLKSDVQHATKKGLGGLVGEQLERGRARLQDSLCSLVEDQYPYAAELVVEGAGAYIGEYLQRARVTREQADRVRGFTLALMKDKEALPVNLGYGEQDAYIRQEILTDFVGLASTDVYSVIDRLGIATEKNVLKDHDPTLRRQELEVLKLYADKIAGIGGRFAPMDPDYKGNTEGNADGQ